MFWLVTLGAGLALTEGLARLLLPEFTDDAVVPESVGRFDPLLGWALKPGVSAVSTATGSPIEYRINSQGLRDDETSLEKPAGVFRIVLLGDSRTFGYGIPVNQHFPRLLEGYFKNVEVLNLGVPGYGVDQELLSLRYKGVNYNPDLVIAYVAHYGDNRHMSITRWGKGKPAFKLRDGRLELINSPVPAPATSGRPASPTWSMLTKFAKTSKIVRVIVMLRDRLNAPSNTPTAASQGSADAEDLKNANFRQEFLDLGEAIVLAMHQEAKAHGADFLLVTQIEQLQTPLEGRGLRVLNVSAALANKRYALPNDLQHFNEAGSGALTWEIARFLKSSGLVAPEHFLPADGPRY